jgi:hypothetical protein
VKYGRVAEDTASIVKYVGPLNKDINRHRAKKKERIPTSDMDGQFWVSLENIWCWEWT